jgi:hypothetical protein
MEFMKTFIFIFSLLFLSFLGISQEKQGVSFKISNAPNEITKENYLNAVEKANFSCYRFYNKSRILKFEDGTELELFSGNAVKSAGLNFDNCFLNDNEPVSDAILKITDAGHLLIEQKLGPSKATVK